MQRLAPVSRRQGLHGAGQRSQPVSTRKAYLRFGEYPIWWQYVKSPPNCSVGIRLGLIGHALSLTGVSSWICAAFGAS